MLNNSKDDSKGYSSQPKTNSEDDDFDINSYFHNMTNTNSEESLDEKYNNTINNEEINKNKPSKEDFDIYTVYTYAELKEVYDSMFYLIYPTFEEFKEAMSEYIYETHLSENTN